jgi:isopentenyl-diphosphate delta-isomerase type 1
MKFDQVILVDAEDTAIGEMAKLPAHEDGRMHRAFSIVIYRIQDDGVVEVLMHKRADTKYHCPGLWTNTCCSHPQPGHSLLDCADERLTQEMGMAADLNRIGTFTYRAEFDNGLIEYEIDHVFIGEFDGGPINPDPGEVSNIKWMTLDQVISDIKARPNHYTPWVAQVLDMTKTAIMDRQKNQAQL